VRSNECLSLKKGSENMKLDYNAISEDFIHYATEKGFKLMSEAINHYVELLLENYYGSKKANKLIPKIEDYLKNTFGGWEYVSAYIEDWYETEDYEEEEYI
jgi:hypothetical protein